MSSRERRLLALMAMMLEVQTTDDEIDKIYYGVGKMEKYDELRNSDAIRRYYSESLEALKREYGANILLRDFIEDGDVIDGNEYKLKALMLKRALDKMGEDDSFSDALEVVLNENDLKEAIDALMNMMRVALKSYWSLIKSRTIDELLGIGSE